MADHVMAANPEQGRPRRRAGAMNPSGVLLLGFFATLLLTGIMVAAQQVGLSRMSVPFLVGSAFTLNRRRATLIGIGGHFLIGLLFAALYAAVFEYLGRATWWLGALGGLLHAGLVLTLGMTILAAVHPNMATDRQGPQPTRWLQPPGFLALNYGRRTPLVALVAHLVYGIVLGGFYRPG